MKKIFLGLFVLIAVLSLTVVLVKAENQTSVALTDGVQIRTDGNNGLRWEAKVTNPEEGQVYGFLFAQGELTAEQLNKDTANVVAKEVEGLKEDGTYHATMVKFPTSAVVQDITVRAYVRTGEEYEYSENVVTRNLAEVAVYSKNTAGGEFVDEVVEYVAENYKKTFEDKNKTLYYDNAIYETNHLALAEAFIKDWNATLGTSLDPKTAFVTNSYDSPFRKSARSGGTDATTSGLYKFFNNEVMSAKWGWILDYIIGELKDGTGYSPCKYQIQVIRGAENTDTSNWYYGFNTISYLQSIFNAKGTSAGSGQFKFENDPTKLALIVKYNNKIYTNGAYSDFVATNATVDLPTIADKAGYSDAWIFDGVNYLEGAKFTLNADSNYVLKSQYSTITYTVQYFLGEEEITSLASTYNVETADVTLPEYVKDGFVFDGWYTTPDFQEGTKVSKIAQGSTGNKVYYAKMIAVSANSSLINYVHCDYTFEDLRNEFIADWATYSDSGKRVFDLTNNAERTTTYAQFLAVSAVMKNETFVAKYNWLLTAVSDAIYQQNPWYKAQVKNYLTQGTSAITENTVYYHFIGELTGYWNQTTFLGTASYVTVPMTEWTPNSTLEIAQGFIDSKTTVTQQSSTIGDALFTPVKDGYTFVGWYTNADYSGNVITVVPKENCTLYAKWVKGNITITEVELSNADLEAIETTLPTKIVNASFTSGIYSINGANYVFGSNAFAKVSDALVAATEGDKIYVFSGTYSDALTIAASNVLLYGPNYNVHGNETRNEEANITALTTINAANVTINGLKFTSAGNIKVGANNVTITNIYMKPSTTVACNGQNRQGCIVDSANISDLTVSNSYINAPGTENSYVYEFMSFNNVSNLTITGNYICNDSQVTINDDWEGMRIYTLSGTFNFSNNEVNWATDGYVIYLANVSAATKVDFIENKFDGNATVKHSATVTVRTGAATTTINFIGNEFYNFFGGTINLSGDKGSTTNIKYNYYAATTKFSFSTRGSSKITYVDNYYAGGINTNVSPTDAGKITSKEALDAAYESYLASLK